MRTLPSRSAGRAAACFLSAAIAAQQPTYTTALEPDADPSIAVLTGGNLFELPGIGSDFILTGGGQFVQLPNGTARLTGRIERSSAINMVFALDLVLGGRLDPAAPGYPPAGSPVLALQPSAYAPAGPVDPGQFRYYTTASGTLTGLWGYNGASLGLQLTGPAVQVGLGANNRNATLGASAQFTVTVNAQPSQPLTPTGNASFQADLISDRQLNATHPIGDPAFSTLTPDRAMDLGGVGSDYLFIPVGRFTEFTDGHGELRGTLARLAQLNDTWDLVLNLGSRIDPGEAGYQAITPTLGLIPSVYAPGGPIDPATWHYYRTASGTLTGTGVNAGGSLTIANTGAFQAGTGANQANPFVGLFGACTVTLVSQPGGRTIAPSGTAALYVLTSIPAVLPIPDLVSTQAPTLSTLTDQGFLLQGNNLAWIETVAIGNDLTSSTDPLDWYRGYFLVLSNTQLEVHPRPGQAPGQYPMSVLNRIFRTNQVTLTLTAPTTPTLRSERFVHEGRIQHLLLHQGSLTGPVFSAIGFSGRLVPSVIPGLVTIGIGNQFQNLTILPGSFMHDPVTGIASTTLGPVPFGFAPVHWNFQAVLLDLSSFTPPLPVSDIWTVDYLQ